MAIQGIFLADFSQYNAAVDQADAKLRKFTASTTTHDTAVRQFSRGTEAAGNSFGQLSQGLLAADKTLGAFGVHIGPEIHALQEMSQAAGQTASQIGLIGTASLTAAAALGGWELGRTIARFFDLDTTIANVTAKMLNFGDVAGQTAAAKQDVLNRALANGAAANITYGEAVEFNVAAEKKRIDALEASAKAQKKAADEQAAALEKERAATEAYAKQLTEIQNHLLGTDQIAKAEDYMRTFMDIRNVTNLNSAALKEFNEVLSEGFSRLVEQGGAATELAAKMNEWRLAVIAAQESHTIAMTTIETDEERVARESAELAKAMSENFKIIGQSAQEAARTTELSWTQAMDAVRHGQGTLTGTIQSPAAGTSGGSIRYDDYGNPYTYVPGMNQPGKISPTSGTGGASVSIFAQGAFFDTPESINKLADKVGSAVMARAAGRGGVF